MKYQTKKSVSFMHICILSLSVLWAGVITGCDGVHEIDEDAAVPADAPVSDSASDSSGDIAETEIEEAETTEVMTEETSDAASIHVVAVGDNLVQQRVYESALAHSDDGTSYNFSYCYENIESLIDGDLNIINQETLICGEGYEISGSNYNFNSPEELGDAIIDLGFNVITICNNHVLDKGESGLSSCLNYWDEKMEEYPDVLVTGIYRDYADMQMIRTKEVNGRTVAFLSYTENTNGYSLPESSDIEIIYTAQEDIIESQIAAAKEIADVVIVTCHWGNEDTYTVTDGQKALAQNIIEWGADVILGTHSHVAHTMEYITRTDGSQGFVFYSLGNFISAQTDNFNLVGELADFNLVIAADGTVTVEDVAVSPVITHYDDGNLSNLRLYPYDMYTEELADAHGLPYTTSSTGPSYQQWSLEEIRSMFSISVPEAYQNLD